MKNFKCVSILFLVLIILLSMVSMVFAKDLVFAMVAQNIADPWHAIIADAAKAECDNLGVKFILHDSRVDQMLQLAIVDDLINMGVDGVAINAVDSKGVVPAIKALNKAGIPVVGFDVLPEGGELLASITFDNFNTARRSGEALIQGLKEKYGEVPEGVILHIMLSITCSVGVERRDGFNKAFEEYPQLKVVEAEGKANPDDAFKATSDLMTRYGKEVIGVYTAAGIMAPGVVSAIKSSGYDLKDIVFTSVEGFAIELQLIDQGLQYSTVCGPTLIIGELGMQFLYYAVNNMTDKIPKVGETFMVPGKLGFPVHIVEYLGGPRINLIAGILCPQDVPIDEPSLLGNLLEKKEKELLK